MKYLVVIAVMALSACGHNTGGNRDYARNCGNAMDELGICGGYSHQF